MEFNELAKIRVDFKDLQSFALPRHIFAETILIDQRKPAAAFIYQLMQTTDALKESKANYIKLKEDSFILIGQLQSLDKQTKQILLTNQNTLSYTHLIIASENKDKIHNDQDFMAGLQALIDALKMRETVHMQLTKRNRPSTLSDIHKTATTISSMSCEKSRVTPLKITPNDNDSLPSIDTFLDRNSKRLFEIHV